MAQFQVTDEFAQYMGNAEIDLNSHVYKAVLTLTAPTKAGTTNLASLTQIAATGGYAAVAVGNPTWAETGAASGVWKFSSDAFSWTATGADFAPARYIAIYNDTATGDPVVGFLDYTSQFIVTENNSLTVTPGANGILTVTVS